MLGGLDQTRSVVPHAFRATWIIIEWTSAKLGLASKDLGAASTALGWIRSSPRLAQPNLGWSRPRAPPGCKLPTSRIPSAESPPMLNDIGGTIELSARAAHACHDATQLVRNVPFAPKETLAEIRAPEGRLAANWPSGAQTRTNIAPPSARRSETTISFTLPSLRDPRHRR